MVSIWEIEIKRALGKLVARLDILGAMEEFRIAPLNFSYHHPLFLRVLPPLHNDPFDRALVAQALAEATTLVTADRKLRAYRVATLPV